ncbi:hypothetical protein [Nonomuraea sp. NPDC050786]|uniref:hypothetical protein n=1 Tax=Nonomuraea sp. NPDC050786 TaxID=3154840 RepID=UPI0033DD05BD
MRRWHGTAMVLAAASALVLGGTTPSHASQNSGWVYVGQGTASSNTGGAYFDADFNGYPNWEKITVCDNSSNGWGVGVDISPYYPSGVKTVKDGSDDGHCADEQNDFWPEEKNVTICVYEYRYGSERGRRCVGGVA